MAERKDRPVGPVDYIDEPDRLALVARRDAKKITNTELAHECGVTSSAMTLLLGRPIPHGKTRGCRFLARLQSALGLAVTARRRPNVTEPAYWRRIEAIVRGYEDDPEMREKWLELGEMTTNRKRQH